MSILGKRIDFSAEFAARDAAENDPRAPMRLQWGPWTFDPKLLTLDVSCYQVDLEQCVTSAQTLDYLAQVSQKTWCTVEMGGYLLRAVNALLRPQSHLCSFGVERSIDQKAIRELILRNARVAALYEDYS